MDYAEPEAEPVLELELEPAQLVVVQAFLKRWLLVVEP